MSIVNFRLCYLISGDYMEFKERIRALREDIDKTQTEIAIIFKTTQRKISRLETGESQPTLQDISQYCHYFNKSADYILGFTNEPKPLPKK